MHVFAPAARLSTLAFTLACVSAPAALVAQQAPYLNPALPPEQRASDLVGRMTLPEKVSQMQNHAVAIPRLGIPAYDWWSEALHGVARSGYATVFPQAIGMAATWDTDLVHQEGETIAREGRAHYNAVGTRQGPRHLLRAGLLVAQHQHLPRSALGARPGDVRRRSVPHRSHGRQLRRRRAGYGPKVLRCYFDAQALCRAQRARARPASLQRRPFAARF